MSAMPAKARSGPATDSLVGIGTIIAVSSCKGGVGKSTVAAHLARANSIGFSITPAYVLQGVALFGHPGPSSLARMIAAAKECDALICK